MLSSRPVAMPQTTQRNLPRRLCSFITLFGALLIVIYGVLPQITDSVGILHRMSLVLSEHNIDPSRYYYSDVLQVRESELYLETVLDQRK